MTQTAKNRRSTAETAESGGAHHQSIIDLSVEKLWPGADTGIRLDAGQFVCVCVCLWPHLALDQLVSDRNQKHQKPRH
jgi:hypothetical protein